MLDINSFNASRILQTVWQMEAVSRVSIAKQLGLNKSTITKILKSMLEDQIIVSGEKLESGQKGGRKAEVLTINDKYGYIMGIEIQTAFSVLCVTGLTGKIVFTDTFPNNGEGQDFYYLINSVLDRSISACKRRGLLILGASLGVSGIIDPYEGVVYKSNPLNVDFPVQVYGNLKDYPFPVLIENDANCCCSKEFVASNLSRKQNFLSVLGEFRKSQRDSVEMSGIAIGLGLAIKGSIHHGDNFSAGEFQSLFKSQENPSQFDLTEETVGLIKNDDQILTKVLRELSKNLSLIVNTMNITHLYFEGNIVTVEKLFRPILRDEIQRNWLYASQVDCQLIFAKEGVSAVAHGAACFFLEKLFSPQKFWENHEEYYPSGIEFFNELKKLKK